MASDIFEAMEITRQNAIAEKRRRTACDIADDVDEIEAVIATASITTVERLDFNDGFLINSQVKALFEALKTNTSVKSVHIPRTIGVIHATTLSGVLQTFVENRRLIFCTLEGVCEDIFTLTWPPNKPRFLEAKYDEFTVRWHIDIEFADVSRKLVRCAVTMSREE